MEKLKLFEIKWYSCTFPVKTKFMEVMGNEKGYQFTKQNRDHLLKYLPKSQDELPPKSMEVSFK